MSGWRWPWARRAQPGDETRWIVLDVETTGLDPARDRLLAIAAVALRLDGPRPCIDLGDSFDVVLADTRDTGAGWLPDAAERHNILLHGIGLGARAAGLEPLQALVAFEQWAGAAPRLGFHVAVDRAVIERAQAQADAARHWSATRWLDIEPLAALAAPQVKAKALDEWLEHFGITCLARHEASADTLATAELLLRLWPALQRQGATDFNALSRLVANRRWVQR